MNPKVARPIKTNPNRYLLQRLSILSILLLAFFLRVYRLDTQSLRGDEAATVLYAALPITDLWELSRITDPHPPLYYLMLHPWQWLFGESAWVMRFAGVAASLLSVATLYALARHTLRWPNAALLAAILLAINPLQIWLAQDVRSYPFFTLFGLLSSWALWEAIQGAGVRVASSRGAGMQKDTQPATRNSELKTYAPWLIYIFLTVACLYIHYYAVFLIAFEGLFVLVNAKKFWQKKWIWLASQIVIFVLIIPGLQLAYNFIGGEAGGGIDKIALPEILQRTFAALLTGFTLDGNWGLWLSILLLPVWIIGIIVLLQRNLTSGSYWLLFFAVPTSGVILLSIDRPFFKERFLIQAQPAFMVLLAMGFVWMWKGRGQGSGVKSQETSNQVAGLQSTQHATRNAETGTLNPHSTSQIPDHVLRFTFYALRIIALALLALLFYTNLRALTNYHTNPTYAKAPPWHLYRDYVSGKNQPGDVMLTNFPEAAVSYYSPNGIPFYVVPAERDRSVDFRLEQTGQIANAYRRIWFLPMLRQGFDEQGDVLNWLDRHADRVDQTFFPVYNINLYLSPATITDLLIGQPAKFANGINLRGYQIFNKRGESRLTPTDNVDYLITVEPGDDLTLSLYWQVDTPPQEPYTVFVHLIAEDGFNRTGHDNQPVWGSYPTTQWSPDETVTDKYTLTIPEGTPPGDHRLRVGWYHSDTLERVALLNSAEQPDADNLVLDIIVRVE